MDQTDSLTWHFFFSAHYKYQVILTVNNDDFSSFYCRSLVSRRVYLRFARVVAANIYIFNPNRFFLHTRLTRSRVNFVRVFKRRMERGFFDAVIEVFEDVRSSKVTVKSRLGKR